MGARYSAVAAKLKAMNAGALRREDFIRLTEMKTVGEICGFLKSTEAWGGALESMDTNDAHRGKMEFLMSEKLFDDFMKIYSFADKRDSEVLGFYLTRREIEFLKREIHYIYTKERRAEGALSEDRFETFFKKHTKIDRAIMKNAKSLEDCIEACRGTAYEEPLTRALNLNADFFMLGMILDEYYYSTLWKAIHSKVPKSETPDFEKMFGSTIDMLNIMWIYRSKKYFNFENEIIFASLLPVRYRLSEDDIRILVMSSGADDIIAAAMKTPYAGLFGRLDEGLFVEENFHYMEYKNSKGIFTMKSSSLAGAAAYVRLKEWEIWRITTVIEGVRYGKSPELIQKHIRTDEGE